MNGTWGWFEDFVGLKANLLFGNGSMLASREEIPLSLLELIQAYCEAAFVRWGFRMYGDHTVTTCIDSLSVATTTVVLDVRRRHGDHAWARALTWTRGSDMKLVKIRQRLGLYRSGPWTRWRGAESHYVGLTLDHSYRDEPSVIVTVDNADFEFDRSYDEDERPLAYLHTITLHQRGR